MVNKIFPNSWRMTTLGEVAVFNYGKGLNTEKRLTGVVPVYGSSGITGLHNKALVNEKGYIIGRKGTVGSIYYSPLPFFPIDTVYYLTKKDIKTDFRYFYYLLETLGLNKLNFDSAVPGLNREMAYSLPIIIPDKKNEQRAIARVLSSFDDKIELLREQNKTLEATAQAIFKEWFVKFNFPNDKGKPYKDSGGKMINSELGEIPEGWRVFQLKDLVSLLKPGTNYQPKRVTKGIPFVNGRNVKNGFLDLTSVTYISNQEYDRVHKMWQPKENNLFITRIGTLGNVGVVRKEDLPLAVHYNIIAIKQYPLRYQFLYFLLTSKYFQEKYHENKKQAVQEFVTIDAVENIKLVFPIDLTNLSNFTSIFDVLFHKIRNNHNQIQTLSKLRDALLPKLMMGEVRANF